MNLQTLIRDAERALLTAQPRQAVLYMTVALAKLEALTAQP